MASSSYLKGITIEIGGNTTGLTNALKEVDVQVRQTQGQLKQVESLLKLDPKNVTLLAERVRLLDSAINDTKTRLEALKKAKSDLEAKGSDLTDDEKRAYEQLNIEIAKTETKLKNLNKEQGEAEKAFKRGEDGAKSFGETLKAILTSEVIKRGFDSISNGIKQITSGVADFIKTGVEFNALIEGYQTAFTAMTGSAEEAQRVLDNLQNTASKGAFDLPSLAQANQALLATGLDAKIAEDTINGLAEAVAYTGGGADVLTRMASNLQQVQNVGKATAMDIRQFGMAGIDIYGILGDYLGKTADEIKDMDISFEDLSGALIMAGSEGGRYFGAMDRQASTLNGQITKLTSTWEAFAGVMATDVTGALQNTFLPILNETLSAMKTGMEQYGVQGMIDALVSGINKMAGAITQELPTLIQTGAQILLGLLQGISSALPQIFPAATSIILELVNDILSMLPELIGVALELIIQFALGISEAIPNLLPTIIDMVFRICQTILDHLDEVINAAIQIIIAVINGLIQALPQLISYVPTIVRTINDVILNNLPVIIDGAFQIIIAVITGLIQGIPELIAYVPEIIDAIADTMLSWLSRIWDVGKNLVEGLWNGIKDAAGWLLGKIKEFCGSILDGFKSFFGIHSPSKLFRDEIGENLGLGIGEGFKDSIPETTKMIDKSLKGLNEKVQASMNATVNPTLSTRPVANTIYFTIDNSGKDLTDEDAKKWGDIIANVVNQKLGMMM